MTWRLLVLLQLAAPPASAQLAVTDPGVTAVAQAQLQLSTLHAQFTKLQMVQDAITLKNTYLQSKQFYDTVYARSQHRGGLMGYYKDYFQKAADNMAASEWRQINNEASSITGQTPMSRLLESGAAAIGRQTGQAINGAGGVIGGGLNGVDRGYKSARAVIFSDQKRQVAAVDQVIAASEDRADQTAKMVADLVKRGSADAISDNERESIDMHAQLLGLQVLSEIRQLLNVNAQILNSQAKHSLAEVSVALKAGSDLSEFRENGGQRGAQRPSNDEMVREMKRRPGER